MYAIRENKIIEIELIKPSRRGTAYWCKLTNIKKLKLISSHKIYNNYKIALEYLNK